jgi:transposase-like protein
MTCDLTAPEFTDETGAIAHMEASRWPDGVICPLCGSDNVRKMETGKQAGMFLCNGCREKFTVRTGTVFERSHIPLHKWLIAMHLMAASKKGVSAHQLHRMLGITYKSAWFMAHRIREAMTPAGDGPKLGGDGKIVESDETELSPSRKTKGAKERKNNPKFMSLIERGGAVRLDEFRRWRDTAIILRNFAWKMDDVLCREAAPWPKRPQLPKPHHRAPRATAHPVRRKGRALLLPPSQA